MDEIRTLYLKLKVYSNLGKIRFIMKLGEEYTLKMLNIIILCFTKH
jgi:hypothetical protein